MGDVLILSRGEVEGYLAQLLLLVGSQLGLDVYLPLWVDESAVVWIRGRILAGRDSTKGGLLEVVGIL